jgi:ribosome-associated heat shock protein Hsp15
LATSSATTFRDNIKKDSRVDDAGQTALGAVRLKDRIRDNRNDGPPASSLRNKPATDNEFIRRVFLDVIGRIPSAEEVREYERDKSPNKRAKLIHRILNEEAYKVKNAGGDFQVEVLALSELRGPAAVAQTLYRETETSRELRLKLAEERKAMPHFEASREGKPSKRDRRELDRFRGRV